MLHVCKIISQVFFSFFQNFDFLVCERATNGPRWQKILSVVLDVSGTIHHMIVIYCTHVWNDNTSRYFFIFSKFCFFRLLGAKRAKKWAKMTKNFVCHVPYLRNHTSYDHWYTYSRRIFHFFKIGIFWVVRIVKGQNMVQNDKKFCRAQ